MSHTIPCLLFFSFLLSLQMPILAQNTTQTNRYIVAIIDGDTRIGKEQKTAIEIAITDFNNNNSLASNLSLTVVNSSGDPFRAASSVQQLINEHQVTAIIGPSTWEETALVADVGNREQVAVLSFATVTITPSLTSLKWPYLVRIANNVSVEMRCIAAIVESYQWHRVIALYEDNGYVGGDSGAVTLLSDALRSIRSEIETRYAFPSLSSVSDTKTVIRHKLEKLKSEQCKVFVVVEMSLSLAAVIFMEAKQLGMMEKGYVWITTDSVTSLLDSVTSSIISPMEGVVGIKTYFNESCPSIRGFRNKFLQNFREEYPEEESYEPSIFALRAYDAVSVIYRNSYTYPIGGQTLLSAVLRSSFNGLSGEIGFKDGELYNIPVFRIINVVGKSYREVGFWTQKLGFSEKFNGLNKKLGLIFGPGGQTIVPRGWAPFTLSRPMNIGVPGETAFGQFVRVTHNSRNETKVSGFCIEVFKEVLRLLPYDLPHKFEIFHGKYDDLVQHVNLTTYDAVVGDTTILANRSLYVEFSQPYVESGLSMLVATESKDSKQAWMFMKPFTKTLWLVTGAIFVYTGIVVWFLEHQRNPDFRGSWPSQISTMLWFTFSTLFFAHRERVQSNFTRIVIVVWLIVVFILTTSYTASLTSMVTVQRLEPKEISIKSLRRSNATVGCDGDSFVLNYLQDVLHFKPDNIKKINSSDLYPAELNSGHIAAAFLEIPYLKVFLSKYCKGFTTTGPTYRFGGFGFVFPKGSPLADDVSEAILKLTENGKLKELEEQLFSRSKCASTSTNVDTSGSLSLENFWGLFVITGGTSTIMLILFIAHLLRKFRRYRAEFEGNASPKNESIWKQTAVFARYFHKGQLHPRQKALTMSSVDDDDWCSVEYASQNSTPKHPQRSPMSIEVSRETA